MSIKEYLARIQNTCALLEVSGSVVPEAEKVEIILAGLSSKFDAILTLASFSTEALFFSQKLVDALLKFESRQSRAATETSIHANLVKTALSTVVTDSMRRGSSFSSLARGRGFHTRLQCQICGPFGHMAQRCYYRFNQDYGGPSAPTLTFSGCVGHRSR
ncbi:hypothetical protein V6Z11_A01G115100 [Gossypium hirsutum]